MAPRHDRPRAALPARGSVRRVPASSGRALRRSIIAALFGLSLPVLFAAAQDGITEKQKELKALKAEIDANRKEIDSLRRKEKDLAKLQGRLQKDQQLTQRYLLQLEEQDSTLRAGLADHQVDLLDKEAAAREAAARLKRGLVRYYKMRHVEGPELLFSSRSFSELFARSQMLARLIHRERIELAALADERQQIAEAAFELEQRRRGVSLLQEEKRREEERLRRQGLEAKSALRDVRGERAARERRIKDLEASQAAIIRMIERLERERALRSEPGRAPLAGGFKRRGLPWPADGKVIGEFGREVNPRYGTQVPSNGIDIAAPEGSPIRAVGPGTVEFVDWLPGYGRTIILNHGGGFYTLYAHASAVGVGKGERVTAGQVIASVGETDSVKGPCLHFEVREGAKALNPREWLR